MTRTDCMVRGIAFRVAAALCFSVMLALLKLASTRGVSAPELVFYRNAFALPLLVVWVLAGPGVPSVQTVRPLSHAWRSVLGVIAMLVGFQALIMLPLAEASTINFMAPVFATILSFFVLQERVSASRWAAVLIGFCGVMVVLRPGASGTTIAGLGVAMGLFAALAQAGVTITIRHLQATENITATVFWFTTVATVVGLALLPFFGRSHDLPTLGILLVAGVIGGTAQLSMTAALGAAPVGVLMPLDYLQLVGAVLLGWLIFGTFPTVYTVIGAALIIGAGMYTFWRERRLQADRSIAAAATGAR